MTVIDFDRVEQHNLGTQSYEEGDIGALKVDALRARCYRATGVEIVVVSQPLTERNAAKLLRHADLVLDTFDTSASRRLVTDTCATLGRPCLHLGMHTDYGEVHWNEGYRVPGDVVAPMSARIRWRAIWRCWWWRSARRWRYAFCWRARARTTR